MEKKNVFFRFFHFVVLVVILIAHYAGLDTKLLQFAAIYLSLRYFLLDFV